MNFFLRMVLVAGTMSAGMVAPFASKQAMVRGAQQTLQQADHALVDAIQKSDAGGAAKLLDDEFSWTDRTGKTRTKAEILPALSSLAADRDMDFKTSDLGQVALIRGSHRIPSQNVSVRFARVWVRRADGWKALIYQETTMAEKTPATRSGFGSPSGGAPVDCENPCKSVPYKPEGAAEQEVVAMWQAVERTVLTNDVEAWIPNFTEDFVFVTPDGGPPLNKADRVAMIKELKRTNTTLIPARVESMKVWVLGDAAVMRSEHKPAHGKTLHITRVFLKRSGHWQITFGQQTSIE
jgi:ketosteroid isomerase-like protein